MPGERLVQIMQQLSKKPDSEETDVITGVVTSVSPLKIKLDKIELTEEFLILGALVQETKINIPAMTVEYRTDSNHEHVIPSTNTEVALVGSPYQHTHVISAWATEDALPTICLWRGLKVGDIVYMIRCAFAQKYYVLQRKEGIT